MSMVFTLPLPASPQAGPVSLPELRGVLLAAVRNEKSTAVGSIAKPLTGEADWSDRRGQRR
jgi:hypothetical protein